MAGSTQSTAGSATSDAIVVDVLRPGEMIALRGRLSAVTIADVRAALLGAVDIGSGDLVVDLTDVELTDASGLGVLVGTHRRCDRGGRRLVLRGVPERIDRLLLATRLHRVLHVDRRPVATIDLVGEPSVPSCA